MHGRGDLDTVIARLRAYQAAGAEALAAPGLPDRAAVERVARAVDRPLVVYVGISRWQPDIGELMAAGVKRASVGSGLARVAWTALIEAASEIRRHGTFGAVAAATPFAELNSLFKVLGQHGQE
jgi:2-methylisocitrate lyase-like PEP mutase family enzyme